MSQDAYRDSNFVPTLIAASNVDGKTPVRVYADPVTHRLLVDLPTSGGTVTTVSVVSANGFAGSVANATTTPAITLTTTITGILKGNGTAISAATDGSDYLSSTTGVTLNQTVGQTIGATGARLTKLWATDITVTNAITGSVTGNAGTATVLATARAIYGNNFDGSAALNQIIASTYGGTGNGFTKFTGPTTSEKTFTLPDANSTIAVTSNNLSVFASTTSAQLAGVLSDETGTGLAVFNNKPTFLGTVQTVTAMAAQALDGSLGNVFTRTLAASETFTQSNFTAGQFFIVEVKQGSGTSYTVTWFSGITWVTSGGTAPTQTTTSNGYTTYGFRCTGTNTFLGYLIGTN